MVNKELCTKILWCKNYFISAKQRELNAPYYLLTRVLTWHPSPQSHCISHWCSYVTDYVKVAVFSVTKSWPSCLLARFCGFGWIETILQNNTTHVLHSLRRRANARNASFRISLGWPIHIINPVDKTKLSSNTPHRRSSTVS